MYRYYREMVWFVKDNWLEALAVCAVIATIWFVLA